MLEKIITLPKSLLISTDDYFLEIQDHRIHSMSINYQGMWDDCDEMLFDFVAACVNFKNHEAFKQMKQQGLSIDALAEICITEIKNDIWAVYYVVEHEGPAPKHERQYKPIYRDYVEAGIISDEKFKTIWKYVYGIPRNFAKFMQINGENIRSECISVLKKSRTYEDLQRNMTPLLTSFGKMWDDFGENNIRREFALELEKSGEDHE